MTVICRNRGCWGLSRRLQDADGKIEGCVGVAMSTNAAAETILQSDELKQHRSAERDLKRGWGWGGGHKYAAENH